MSYESPEERIDRLQNRVEALEKILQLIIDFLRAQNDATEMRFGKLSSLLIKGDAATFQIFKVLVDHSPLDAGINPIFSKMLDDHIKNTEKIADVVVQEIQTLAPVLPDNLFWKPPQNPPGGSCGPFTPPGP